MSFLNPVSEPVLRFSSTDSDAPQLNYADRTAGDIKTVLKACLVTGYGDKAGAGWQIENEEDYTAEFVSPAIAMSDYKLQINDERNSTHWHYIYNDKLVTPNKNQVDKSISYTDKTNSANGWQLLVASKGFYFIETVLHRIFKTVVMARITYFGQVKSALQQDTAANIAFWCVGAGSPNPDPREFFKTPEDAHYRLADYTRFFYASTFLPLIASQSAPRSTISATNIYSPFYLVYRGALVAEQPGVLFQCANTVDGLYGSYDSNIQNRPVLYVGVNSDSYYNNQLESSTISICIYLDHWSY